MRVFGLLVALGAWSATAQQTLDDLKKDFPQPRHRHLRKGELHASKKVYPPAPSADQPKTFDVWRPYFRELYEKVRRAPSLAPRPSTPLLPP